MLQRQQITRPKKLISPSCDSGAIDLRRSQDKNRERGERGREGERERERERENCFLGEKRIDLA